MTSHPPTRRPTPKLGDRRWKLEWCKEVPKDENGDAILDAAVYVKEAYPTEDAAVSRAHQLIRDRLDWFGCVRICQQEVEVDDDIRRCEGRIVLAWTDIGEAEDVSD